MGLIDSVKAAPSALLACLRQSATFLQKRTGLFVSGVGRDSARVKCCCSSFFVQAPRAPTTADRHRNLYAGLEEVDLKAIDVLPPSKPRRMRFYIVGARGRRLGAIAGWILSQHAE
jgi:hypothetical protein